MLHNKFQGNLPTGSREEDIWRVFTINGYGDHLGHVTLIHDQTFILPVHESFIWNLASIPPVGSEMMMFQIVVRWHTEDKRAYP